MSTRRLNLLAIVGLLALVSWNWFEVMGAARRYPWDFGWYPLVQSILAYVNTLNLYWNVERRPRLKPNGAWIVERLPEWFPLAGILHICSLRVLRPNSLEGTASFFLDPEDVGHVRRCPQCGERVDAPLEVPATASSLWPTHPGFSKANSYTPNRIPARKPASTLTPDEAKELMKP